MAIVISIAQNQRNEVVLDQFHGNESVLDIGCVQHDADRATNDHWLHGELARVVDSLVGMDLLAEEVEELNNRGYNVIHGNAESFSLDRTFDAVIAGELIEHLANPGSFLECARSHLHEDGKLVLTTPNPWYGRRFAEAATGRVRCNPEHTAWFDEQTLRQLLARYDFTPAMVRYTPAPRFKPRYTPMNLESHFTNIIYRIGFRLLGGYSLVIVATPT